MTIAQHAESTQASRLFRAHGAGRCQPQRTGFTRPPGEWNEGEIAANGRQITIKLNGVIVLDVNLDIVKEPKILEKHPGLLRASGHLGLLGHNERTEFRNLRIKALP